MKLATREQLAEIAGLMRDLPFIQAQAFLAGRKRAGFLWMRGAYLQQVRSWAAEKTPWPSIGFLVDVAQLTDAPKDWQLARDAIRDYSGTMIGKFNTLVRVRKSPGNGDFAEWAIAEARQIAQNQLTGSEQALALAELAKVSGVLRDLFWARHAAQATGDIRAWGVIATITRDPLDLETMIGMVKIQEQKRISNGVYWGYLIQVARARIEIGGSEHFAKAREIASELPDSDRLEVLLLLAEKTKEESVIEEVRKLIKQLGGWQRRRLVIITADAQELEVACSEAEERDGKGSEFDAAFRKIEIAKAITAVYGK